MAEALTEFELLQALKDRSVKRSISESTRLEIAAHLHRSGEEIGPLLDQAIEEGLVEEHPNYKENWRLTEQGEIRLAEGISL